MRTVWQGHQAPCHAGTQNRGAGALGARVAQGLVTLGGVHECSMAGGLAGRVVAASRTMRLVILHAHRAMRQAVLSLEESRIREVANVGLGRSDVLAFWFGESDEGTPDVVRQAAIDSLQRGETFYAHNLGLPELRAEVAAYTSRLHRPVGADRIAITSGGVNALMLAVQALVDAGDEVVAITPVWPNLTAQPLIMGANLRCVSLRPQPGGAWALDMPELLAAITPATRLLVVNAPNNPTGWTLTAQEQQTILAHCRATGT